MYNKYIEGGSTHNTCPVVGAVEYTDCFSSEG